ncbi:hypothetical protein [Methylobacterium pseudosasicola]|uniref:hypothetical protein n=1 Tax=Methylobacterium pseudosasicola TaxID=582667 RepID=UPI001113EB45|nr:hypothetical protein [Methylobacterium pseudosasicola]
MSDALQLLGLTEKSSFDLVAALIVGRETASNITADGRVKVQYESALPGSPSVTILGKSDTIRGKSKLRARKGSEPKYLATDDANWRLKMALAFAATFSAKDPNSGTNLICQLTSEIGETEYAEAVLLPMLRAKFDPPNFSPPD